MKMTNVNPLQGIYPASGDYVHALQADDVERLLFVSGTMGLDVDGKPGETLEAQLTLIWSNIRRILAEASMDLSHIARVTSYLTDRAQVLANQNARVAALGDRRVPTTAIVVQTLDDDWLVEIEVIAIG
ncbi:RidA family protein [Hoeflea sp.]|uniref:RidA family protein n=1 Tax=Hoeflea sp. TaxID=1940281 RepID=UPI003A912ADD